ncbi:histidine--tRNA ligase [Candidatus Woesearchaeota archaeon]|nr:histidine--tRNA ligase [Candidatus Woesearchaeota archaeon]
METQPPRGMRDAGPEEAIFSQRIIGIMRERFEIFGFSPLETPIVERWEVLSAKYAGGEDILKEAFRLKDQGDRDLGLRYDLTVPLARYVACNPNIKMPFKRYAIGRVYRDGPIKLGRYREFMQCDCDIIGADTAAADAQCVQLALSVFDALNMKVKVVINNVALLKLMLQKVGIPEDKLTDIMLSLDKLKKIGKEGVQKELKDKGLNPDAIENIIEVSGSEDRIQAIKSKYGDSPELERVSKVLELAKDARVEFDPSLSRGLSYYTGMVFEAFLVDSEITSSVAGGGRYDRMIGGFIGRPDDYPAVGISFGLAPIMDASEKEARRTVTDIFIIPIKTPVESNALVQELRSEGIRADTDLLERSISKNLDYANVQGMSFVVLLGENELKEGKYKLKDMGSGDEKLLTKTELIDFLKER